MPIDGIFKSCHCWRTADEKKNHGWKFLKEILMKSHTLYAFGTGICPLVMSHGDKLGRSGDRGFWWWCWRGQ